ncbi:hypothetical protein HIM_00823 [Hirsutella minnesotensis 3608]|nr:hypothetical protein HIM_00823 [Hirsutella minnesotensis 3608]
MSLSRGADRLSAPEANPNALLVSVFKDLWNAETNPNGFINLGTAENSLMSHETLEHMHKHLKIPPEALTYGDGHRRLKKAVARFLTRRFNPVKSIEPGHIFVSNGCTAAVETLSWACANPGDGILIGRPYYGTFPTDVGKRTRVELIPLNFGDVDPMSVEAVEQYADAIEAAKERGQRIAAILIAHPHNPLGLCYSREALVAYLRVCQKYQVHLICDEIYACSVFDNAVDKEVKQTPFESVLSIDPTGIVDPSLVHVVWGMSKDFGANGLRMGFTITQHHKGLQTALQSVFEFQWTSSLSDLVTANMLEDDKWVDKYLAENAKRLSVHHDKVLEWARKHNVEYVQGSNGGFFIWANLGKVYRRNHPGPIEDLDKAVMDSLIAHRVFLADGVRFGSEKPGWFRIIFSRDAEYLRRGVQRIAAAIGGGVEEAPRGNNVERSEADVGVARGMHQRVPVMQPTLTKPFSTVGTV